MTFHLITIFPEIFDSYLKEGILRRAQEKEQIKVKVYNLRDFATDKHQTVDDTPYGGGPGMVLKPEPIFRCVEKIKAEVAKQEKAKLKVLLTSAKGGQFNQKKAAGYTKLTDLVIICGRYEGVDERVAEYLADEEIAVGEYVLTGGELPALIILDAVSRLLPEVLGNESSLQSESYQESGEEKFDYPVYTKPPQFEGKNVPEVLLSGDHNKIEKWRKAHR